MGIAVNEVGQSKGVAAPAIQRTGLRWLIEPDRDFGWAGRGNCLSVPVADPPAPAREVARPAAGRVGRPARPMVLRRPRRRAATRREVLTSLRASPSGPPLGDPGAAPAKSDG